LAGSVMSSATASRSSYAPSAARIRSGLQPVATTALPAARAALAMSTPMPRPAPVINQIFLVLMEPPFSGTSVSGKSAVDRQGHAEHEARARTAQPEHRCGDLVGTAQAGNGLIAHDLLHRIRRYSPAHGCIDHARAHGI